jgi:hypothetical protein
LPKPFERVRGSGKPSRNRSAGRTGLEASREGAVSREAESRVTENDRKKTEKTTEKRRVDGHFYSRLGRTEHNWDLRSTGREAPKRGRPSRKLFLCVIRPRISQQSPEYGGPNHHLGSVSTPARNPGPPPIFSARRRTPGITREAGTWLFHGVCGIFLIGCLRPLPLSHAGSPVKLELSHFHLRCR